MKYKVKVCNKGTGETYCLTREQYNRWFDNRCPDRYTTYNLDEKEPTS